jgi:ribosomal protein S2
LLSKTKHIFIPKSAWITGIITNKSTSLKSLFKQKTSVINRISARLLRLKKKSDLIVIIDQKLDVKAIEESYISKIPVIAFNSDLNAFYTKTNYKIPGNFTIFKNRIKNNFLYSILLSTLKKSDNIKKRFPNLQHKLNTIKIIKKQNNKTYYKKNSYAFQKKK